MLPTDVWLVILDFLERQDIQSLADSSKYLRSVSLPTLMETVALAVDKNRTLPPNKNLHCIRRLYLFHSTQRFSALDDYLFFHLNTRTLRRLVNLRYVSLQAVEPSRDFGRHLASLESLEELVFHQFTRAGTLNPIEVNLPLRLRKLSVWTEQYIATPLLRSSQHTLTSLGISSPIRSDFVQFLTTNPLPLLVALTYNPFSRGDSASDVMRFLLLFTDTVKDFRVSGQLGAGDLIFPPHAFPKLSHLNAPLDVAVQLVGGRPIQKCSVTYCNTGSLSSMSRILGALSSPSPTLQSLRFGIDMDDLDELFENIAGAISTVRSLSIYLPLNKDVGNSLLDDCALLLTLDHSRTIRHYLDWFRSCCTLAFSDSSQSLHSYQTDRTYGIMISTSDVYGFGFAYKRRRPLWN